MGPTEGGEGHHQHLQAVPSQGAAQVKQGWLVLVLVILSYPELFAGFVCGRGEDPGGIQKGETSNEREQFDDG